MSNQVAVNDTTSDPRSQLLGTYTLLEHWNRDAHGAITYQFGSAPIGYMTFDEAGRFSVHITRTPSVQPFQDGPDKPRPEEAIQLLRSYYSAFGSYDVDLADSVIVFRSEGATRPDLVGTKGRFPFRFVEANLVIGDGNTWHRVWKRLSPQAATGPDA